MQTASRVTLSCDGEIIRNPLADPQAAYGEAQEAILSDAGLAQARAAITAWPGYATTPLHRLEGLAREAGVAALHYKDEGPRFGLGSFKALGGAYAVAQLLRREIAARRGGEMPAMEEILRGDHRDVVREITVCCATDGNHGRSVAWGAQTFGCNCVIFIHATVSEGRKTAIEAYGAEVRRTTGNYDDSVREAQHTAEREGWFVVSDTSYPGYTEIPKDVMQGYELMAAEADAALAEPPTHILLQTGVGGMAAAVAAYFKRRYGAARPKIILADPVNSACWAETIRAGVPTAVHGDLDTLMAGLACGEISINAWEVLRESCDAVVTVSDADAIALMTALAAPTSGDTPIVAGESAVAGLAALFTLMRSEEDRAALELGPDARVLVFGTEADTDPALYQQLVGRSAAQVLQVT
ncbi:diaminopropionate ammonia-lyase [Limimaricola pyoseonensis]|uniref:Diaminopropionate ammonia-lyase n=1 Tax=Limimaricola pyoseonensis TaxID=521013 RepID=A0A1G7BVH0_9RHOB|nr:diaminopropionate ammonia-lyase [Limimaricola pyoseonensis]SDE31003.1 diaminopropionate ammonia-lyase [Limimaricola pyoseonensis]